MRLFPTEKREALQASFVRAVINLTPVIRSTGGWVKFLSKDWQEMHVSLPLSLKTRNYVGTIFGGSLFSAGDPWYMIMLYQVLGKGYVIWDKSASIRFVRPGKGKLKGRFLISEKEITEIKDGVAKQGEMEKSFLLEWINKEGKVVAKIDKLVYIADKNFYNKKRRSKKSH
ncbi:MAG: DUF4442 domain-containing protein [Bacteroidia bacterium]|nr:DUF4442 domain-containing protein [Bacteroidia bacterium]